MPAFTLRNRIILDSEFCGVSQADLLEGMVEYLGSSVLTRLDSEPNVDDIFLLVDVAHERLGVIPVSEGPFEGEYSDEINAELDRFHAQYVSDSKSDKRRQ